MIGVGCGLGSGPYGAGMIVRTLTQPATSLVIQLDVRSFTTGQQVFVNWGDGGATETFTLSATVDTALSHTYASGAARTVTIYYADRITRLTSTYSDGRSNFGGDISRWTWLTYLFVYYGSNTLSGSVAGLTNLTYLSVAGSNTLSGSVTELTNLTCLSVAGNNTLSGSVAGLTKLTYLLVTGSNTLSGSVTELTKLTLLYVSGSNTLSGSVAGLTNLTLLYVLGSNTLSGSVAGLTKLTYLYVSGSNTITDFDLVAANATKLAYFRMNNQLTETVVDGILNGFWTNRDVAKTRTERTIDLDDNALSSAPSAAGLVVKAALQEYVSPPGSTVWTVTTR